MLNQIPTDAFFGAERNICLANIRNVFSYKVRRRGKLVFFNNFANVFNNVNNNCAKRPNHRVYDDLLENNAPLCYTFFLPFQNLN